MANKSKVAVEITAVDKTKAAFKSVNKSLGGMKKAFAGIASIVSVGGFGLLTKNSIQFADAIDKAAARTGFAIETLQELRFAADQSGVGFKELDGGLARFTKRLGLARDGNKGFADTYRKLGIDINQTHNQVFKQVVDTLGAMENETNRLAITTRLFGDDAQKLALMFKNGTAGLDAFADKARELGIILDKDLVKGAAKANDQFSIMRQTIKIQFVRAFLQLAPAITAVGNAFGKAAPKVSKFFESFLDIGNQSRGAVEETLKKTAESFAIVRKKLERRIALDADPIKFNFFLESREVLEAKLVKLEARYLQGIKRIKEINKREGKNIASALDTGGGKVDLSGWLDQGENDKVNAGLAKRNKLLEEAQSVFESTRTPAEKYAATVQRLKEIQKELPGDTFARAIDQARIAFEEADPATQAHLKQLEEVQAIYDGTRTKLEQFSIEVGKVRELLSAGVLDEELAQRQIDKLAEGMKEIKKENDALNDAFSDLGFTFASTFEDAVVEGGKLSDILQGLEKDIKRIIARKLITEPLAGAASSFLGGLFPARALGGPVTAGTPYLVGEQGPELFVPNAGGKIAQASPSVNISINNSAASGNYQSDMQLAAKVGQAVNRALRRNR